MGYIASRPKTTDVLEPSTRKPQERAILEFCPGHSNFLEGESVVVSKEAPRPGNFTAQVFKTSKLPKKQKVLEASGAV